MNLRQFILAGVIVTIPLVILDETSPQYSGPYIFLILFSLLVFYSKEVSGFVGALRGEL